MMLPSFMTPGLDFATTVFIIASFLVPLFIWISYNVFQLHKILGLAYEIEEDALDLLKEHYRARAEEEMERYDDLNEYLFDNGEYMSTVPDGSSIFHETFGCQTYAEENEGTYMESADTCLDPFGQESRSQIEELKPGFGKEFKKMFKPYRKK